VVRKPIPHVVYGITGLFPKRGSVIFPRVDWSVMGLANGYLFGGEFLDGFPPSFLLQAFSMPNVVPSPR